MIRKEDYNPIIFSAVCSEQCLNEKRSTPQEVVVSHHVDHLEQELEALDERRLALDEAGREVRLDQPVYIEMERSIRSCTCPLGLHVRQARAGCEPALCRVSRRPLGMNALSNEHIAHRLGVEEHKTGHSHQHVRRALCVQRREDRYSYWN